VRFLEVGRLLQQSRFSMPPWLSAVSHVWCQVGPGFLFEPGILRALLPVAVLAHHTGTVGHFLAATVLPRTG
jgi:hypothetical protein